MSALDDVRRALDEAYGTGVIFDGLTGADLLAAVIADTELACRDAVTKATTPAATPDFFQPDHTYTEPGDVTDWKFRCDFITTHPQDGERTALGWRHFRGEWTECAYGEDDWEIHRLADAIGATEGGDQ